MGIGPYGKTRCGTPAHSEWPRPVGAGAHTRPVAPAKKGASRRGGACPRPRAAIKAAPTDAGCCGRASRGKNSPRGDADVLPGAATPYIIKRETAGSGRFGRERALFYSFVTNAPEVLTFCERCFIMRTEARGVILD